MNLYIASLTSFGVFGLLILGPEECLEVLVARLVTFLVVTFLVVTFLVTFLGDEDLVLDMILIK